HYSCPDFELKATYLLPKPCYLLAVDGRGKLYAATPSDTAGDSQTAKEDSAAQKRIGDIAVYDLQSLSTDLRVPPVRVIQVGGVINQFLLAPDASRLYYFDITKRTIGRVDLARGEPAGELADFERHWDYISLTPDGSSLFAVAKGVFYQIDAKSF